ncbi:MAG: hypothetical protein JW803_09750 [Endomicrobiales bacterium]|nr:hypothetical protein [Endomicrobiales bacterium]
MVSSKSCSREKNLKKCNCTYSPCPRKGICCECIEYHWFNSRELPACFFPNDAEKTYDRSLEHFLKVWGKTKG